MKLHNYSRIGWFAKSNLIIASGLWLILVLPFPQAWGQSQNTKKPDIRLKLSNALKQPDSLQNSFEAEVWLTDMSARLSSYIKAPGPRIKLLRLIYNEAQKASLKPELVLAIIETESAFNQFAVSSSGAQGLMQVMPFWKDIIGRTSDNLTQVHTNLKYGCTILSLYLKQENGNITRALARYNGSLGTTWYANRVIRNWQKNWVMH